ncbi:MAG: CHAP domain-containing protein [Clostridia bacterium]|nr:CHAP domain-containing protein [Clostridia bacterium]
MKSPTPFLRLLGLLLSILLPILCLPITPVLADFENTYSNTGNQAADLVGVAKTQIGYHEGSNNYNKYGQYFGNPNAQWCGYFVSWCARQANIPTSILPNTGWSDGFNTCGVYHERSSGYIPQIGDLMIYGSYYDTYHVSIVERYDSINKCVWVIDGNWSDQVSSHSEKLTESEVAGFITPNYIFDVKEVTLYNLITPTVIKTGSSFSIGGVAASNHHIQQVVISVTDEHADVCISASAKPNAYLYDLKDLDASLPFGKLRAGSYLYNISVKDSVTTRNWSYSFTVQNDIAFTLDSVCVPSSLAAGESFTIGGIITCAEELQTVGVSVYDQNGIYRTGCSAVASSTTYDISKMAKQIKFADLATGDYTLIVAARSKQNTYKEWSYSFSVVPFNATFKKTNIQMPSSLPEGFGYAISGAVSANQPLTGISVKVLTSDREMLSATAAPHETSYRLADLNDQLDFSTLPAGSYTIVLRAEAESDFFEWTYPLTVGDFKVIFSSHDVDFPSTLQKGAHYSISGIVGSNVAMTDVSISVLSGETPFLHAAAQPHVNSFLLSELDDDLDFSKLPAGKYTILLRAAAGNDYYHWRYNLTVEGDQAVVFASKNVAVPSTLSKGTSYTVSGIVGSTDPLTTVSLTVAVGNTVYLQAAAHPNVISYSLSGLADQLAFETLPVGQYAITLRAEAAGTYHQWQYTLTVTQSTTSAPKPFVLGDLDGNGILNMADAFTLYRVTAGHIALQDSRSADMDGNGVINVMDAFALYRLITNSRA